MPLAKGWSISGQRLHSFGMALERCIHTMVVTVSVCTESEEDLYDRLGRLQCAPFKGPGKRKNALSATLDCQPLVCAFTPGRTANRLPQMLSSVGADYLHNDG